MEHIRFHFDPVCPWCYQTSRWLGHLAALGRVQLSWGLFSLQVAHGEPGQEHGRLHPGVAAFYEQLGRRIHEQGASPKDGEVIAAALEAAGLARELAGDADRDDVVERLLAEHRRLVEDTCSFGVPTIALDGGGGPTYFGPVLIAPPEDDATATALLDHITGLARHEGFVELKRERDRAPDLASVRHTS
ncbi:MAG: hypothetical protein BRC32_06080 [Actinobacteria bacterium QS_8_72_14]|nr:MAG: hypothetical protein BRC32_06080 [Actinobacteria bacterium QS_8_72_14]